MKKRITCFLALIVQTFLNRSVIHNVF